MCTKLFSSLENFPVPEIVCEMDQLSPELLKINREVDDEEGDQEELDQEEVDEELLKEAGEVIANISFYADDKVFIE